MEMSRFAFYKVALAAIFAVILLGGFVIAPTVLAVGNAHWGYEGKDGPAHWGEIDATFNACGDGQQQSPVNLASAYESEAEEIALNWRSFTPGVVNNGHTIQVNVPTGSYADFGGERYDLLQFHFHHRSEHTIGGESYPMEAHFVHKSAVGNLMVVGVMLKEGAPNSTLQQIWDLAPAKEGKADGSDSINPAALGPKSKALFRYEGSLTTPPCTEIVSWVVFAEPIEISAAQIKRFAKLYSVNNRPVQPLNRRFVLSQK